jgi:hypothetical protein
LRAATISGHICRAHRSRDSTGRPGDHESADAQVIQLNRCQSGHPSWSLGCARPPPPRPGSNHQRPRAELPALATAVKSPQTLDTLVDEPSRGGESCTDSAVAPARHPAGQEWHYLRCSDVRVRTCRSGRPHRVILKRAEGLRHQEHGSFDSEEPQPEQASDKCGADDGATRQRPTAAWTQPDSCRCRPHAGKAWLADV